MTNIIVTAILECFMWLDGCTIWEARLKAIVDHVISQWKQFTIWNAGKEGHRFYRSLGYDDQQKVIFMAGSCDALSVYIPCYRW